jgi:PhnB protein
MNKTKKLKSKVTSNNDKPFFAPRLLINNGINDISFYAKAFGETENLCFCNDDDCIHVAELSIDGIMLHIHEVPRPYFFSPEKHNGTTSIFGLFVPDVHAVISNAIKAGAK